MDTKAVAGEKFEFVKFEEAVEILELEDHKEESFDPRNRNGLCLNS